MRRIEYTEQYGKRHRYIGVRPKREQYLALEERASQRHKHMEYVIAPAVSALYHPGSHTVSTVKPKKAKAHRFSPELELEPRAIFSDRVEEVPSEVGSSQLIPAPMSRPAPMLVDQLPQAPPKRFRTSLGSFIRKQPHLSIALERPIKGIGYVKPGNPLANRPRVLKNQFAFDVIADIGKREFARTMWRHGKSGYSDTAVDVLSPALRGTARTVDGVSISTPVRRGHYSSDDVLYSANSLWDLETASWNANGFKLVSDMGPNIDALPSTSGILTVQSLGVYPDFKPAVDHNKGTPFFDTTTTNNYATQQRPPFMVNLGKGSINMQLQNRLPTDAVIEIVVFQCREQLNSEGTTYFHMIENYSTSTTALKRKGLVLGDTLGGQAKATTDPLLDPLHKFLSYYPKYSNRPPPFKLRTREKFILKGATNKSVSIHLPASIYSSRHNHNVCGDPFATIPSNHSNINHQTFMIYFAVHGVVMPVFTYPKSNATNDVTATDYVNETAVDMQPCNADVLFTGEYIEHPRPCLATAQELVYDNHHELADVTVTDSANWGLVTGFVSELPTTINTGQVTTFGAGTGRSTVSGAPGS